LLQTQTTLSAVLVDKGTKSRTQVQRDNDHEEGEEEVEDDGNEDNTASTSRRAQGKSAQSNTYKKTQMFTKNLQSIKYKRKPYQASKYEHLSQIVP